jgi:hypothetical protein
MERDATGSIGSQQLLDHGPRGRVDLHRGGIARPLRMQSIAIRRPCPRQELATAEFAQPPAPHAVTDQRPFVLSHGPTDLQHQLFVRVITQWPIDKEDPHSPSLELLQHHQLVRELARQPLWGGEQDHIEGRPRGLIT